MSGSRVYIKPLPDLTPLHRPFLDATREHRLVIQRCTACHRHQFPATRACPSCGGPMAWTDSCGRGCVHTFTVLHKVYHPGFADEVPYNVAVVELEEGPFMISNVVGCRNDEITVGMPVDVVFEDVTDDVTLAKFAPAQRRRPVDDVVL